MREVSMTPVEQFLHLLANPNIALLLLSLGGTAIIIELYSPGGYVAGIFGVIALLLGFYALGVLEANYAGLGLIGLAFALFLFEALTPSIGVFALGGVIAFVLGASMLFDSSFLRASWAVILTVALALGAFFAFAIGAAIKERRRQPLTGREGLVGQIGEVRERLDPEGIVLVAGERWTATTSCAPLEPGTRVRVLAVEQMRLVVEPVNTTAAIGEVAEEHAR
ncbi:MAG: NfeD family protein [Ardenticatenia bacterium]|nr:NfeD family protein [Ardenticatenia bacterium]